MARKRLFSLGFLWWALTIGAASPVLGDIYRYQDEEGVWHFTNIKKDNRYKLFIRERAIGPKEYIRDYDKVIVRAAREYRVDPTLIKAIIKAESDFDHRAVSYKGAQGLMQLMPGTAAQMEVRDSFDPEENILGGTRYLGLLIDRFDQDLEKAVAAYNCGPERVESHNGIPPIPETTDFVRKVMGYYRKFQGGGG
jgi:soluble lytic murein transglycosylase